MLFLFCPLRISISVRRHLRSKRYNVWRQQQHRVTTSTTKSNNTNNVCCCYTKAPPSPPPQRSPRRHPPPTLAEYESARFQRTAGHQAGLRRQMYPFLGKVSERDTGAQWQVKYSSVRLGTRHPRQNSRERSSGGVEEWRERQKG